MRLLGAAVASALALALAPTVAVAEPLTVGSADGVRVVQGRGGVELVFARSAGRLWREVAGRRVEFSCTQLGDARLGLVADDESGFVFRAPKRGRRLRPGPLAPRRGDWCTLSSYLRHRNGDLTIDPLVRIPLTQAGAVVLDEREKAGLMTGVLAFASALGDSSRGTGGYPTALKLNDWLRNALPRRIQVVALPTASDTPPAGRLGYWTDGGASAAVVTLSAAGRRLFVEVGPDDLLRTNVARAIFAAAD